MRKWVSKPKPHTPKSAVSPRLCDLAWAAGFLEGEGSFIRSKSCVRGCEMISAAQKKQEPLNHLQMLFGGSLTTRPSQWGYRMNVWQVYGARARGIMMTMFSFMSKTRQCQIKLALLGG